MKESRMTLECTKDVYVKVFHTNGDSRLRYEEFIVFGTTEEDAFMFLVANLKKNFDINLLCEFLDKFSKYDKDINNVISSCGLNIVYPDFNNDFLWSKVGGIPVCLGLVKLGVEIFVTNIENYEKKVISVSNAYGLRHNYFIDDIYNVYNSSEKVVEIKVGKVGSFCRSCGEYNNYAEVDKVIEDGKYTCWNCANSNIRIYRGLNCDNLNKAVMMIRKNNNIREE
jgi:hypothetical protein